mmetsp:Transcript_69715/g.131427  ORF Transcript_69715/g.131427 Transcript_69715/m.131427 type:complete len:108 (-) Transcript_69715:99-422(-)
MTYAIETEGAARRLCFGPLHLEAMYQNDGHRPPPMRLQTSPNHDLCLTRCMHLDCSFKRSLENVFMVCSSNAEVVASMADHQAHWKAKYPPTLPLHAGVHHRTQCMA